MTDDPYIYLAAKPTTPVSVPTIFRSAGVNAILENPPTLRQPALGWDLVTYDRAQIVGGDHLRLTNGERKIIDLYRDGSMIMFGSLLEFLGWPRTEEQFAQQPELNSLAFVELVFNFCQTYLAVIDYFEPVPDRVTARIGYRNFTVGNRSVFLAQGIPGRIGFPRRDGHEAPTSDGDLDPIDFDVTGYASKSVAAEHLAFALLKSFYNRFAHQDEIVPFARLNEGRIDTDAFLAEVRHG